MTEAYVLMDVLVSQEGSLYRYRCAHSTDGARWSVICADNVGGRYSAERRASQERNFQELVNEMHPFERMRPRPNLEQALADFGMDDDAPEDDLSRH